VSKAAIQQRAPAAAVATGPASSPRKQKLQAFLVTEDVDLWRQVGAHLTQKLTHRQIDSVDELLSAVQTNQPAVVLWDARGSEEQAAVVARLQAHSARFVIVALDDAEAGPAWSLALQHGQVVALVPVPVDEESLTGALTSAYEEVQARIAILGDGAGASTATAGSASGGRPRLPWIAVAAVAAVLIAGVAAFLILRPGEHASPTAAGIKPAPSPVTPVAVPAPAPAAAPTAEPSAPVSAGTEEKVDTLIEQAQRAMRDRHFIEPADGSALSLYRSALVLDPGSGEARQGLQRLAEILLARVQSALDERQFDAALQALETVRSIDPADSRLPALDERIAKMRAELGPAEIQAAINAQNFDRAAQLIDAAARSKSFGEPKINQLREDLRRHRAESDVAHLVQLIDARLQQDQLTEPQNDSAVYYLNQAKRAGAGAADLQTQYRELLRRLTLSAHSAIDQHRLLDADRFATELRNIGAPLSAVTALQHEIGAARAQLQHEQSTQSRFLDLTRSRLTQGNVIVPENDNALYYLNQLRAADPQNNALPQLSKAVQTQILDQARAALDAAQPAQAETLLQLASALGGSADLEALNERLRLAKQSASGVPRDVPEATLTRTRKLDIEYPDGALQKKIEGTVEIGYIVTPKGTVAEIKILNSNPPGIFDRAAINAVSRLRYKPVLEGGQATAVATKMLVIFRLEH
jgi:TonB family protein